MSVSDVTMRQPDPVDYDKQTTGATTRPRMPVTGEYTLLTTSIEWLDREGRPATTKAGYKQATLTFKVIDPGQPHDNYEMRYQRINTQKWPGKESNSMLDYLRAHGIQERPQTNEDYEALINTTLNRPFRAMVDWRAYDKATAKAFKTMTAFPKRDDGNGYQPWILAEGGGDTKIFANAEVKYYKDAA